MAWSCGPAALSAALNFGSFVACLCGPARSHRNLVVPTGRAQAKGWLVILVSKYKVA